MKSIKDKNRTIRKPSYILNIKDIQNVISLSLRNSYYFPVDDSVWGGWGGDSA